MSPTDTSQPFRRDRTMAGDVQIRRDGPGAWDWIFVFCEQILAQAGEAYPSDDKAKTAAIVFARDVGVALKKLPTWG